MVFKDQNKFVFYVNNYINWDQFNQLFDLNWIKRVIQNANAIVRKLRPALIRASNDKLEVAWEKKQKTKEMIKRWKTKAIAAKYCRDRRGISLFSKEERNYESEIGDDTNLNQANNKYLL